MTLPEPLQWVVGTLTVWHYVIWGVYAGLGLKRRPKQEKGMPFPFRVWGSVFIFPIFYCMVALVVGQIFGDKYSWSQLWPAGLYLGAIFSTAFLTGLVPALRFGAGKRIELTIMTVVFVPLAAGFFGLFFSLAWWLLPRIVGFGLIDIPKLSWGVQL